MLLLHFAVVLASLLQHYCNALQYIVTNRYSVTKRYCDTQHCYQTSVISYYVTLVIIIPYPNIIITANIIWKIGFLWF